VVRDAHKPVRTEGVMGGAWLVAGVHVLLVAPLRLLRRLAVFLGDLGARLRVACRQIYVCLGRHLVDLCSDMSVFHLRGGRKVHAMQARRADELW
jgi:hypothetical protein